MLSLASVRVFLSVLEEVFFPARWTLLGCSLVELQGILLLLYGFDPPLLGIELRVLEKYEVLCCLLLALLGEHIVKVDLVSLVLLFLLLYFVLLNSLERPGLRVPRPRAWVGAVIIMPLVHDMK